MASRLRFEGRSLTDLLGRLRSEYGEDARIVGAERLRSGGVAGFFVRESYVVTVELDEPPAEAGLPALSETIAAVEAAERVQTEVALSTRASAKPPPPPTLSTAGPQFASVLARLQAIDAPPPVEPVSVAVPADDWDQLRAELCRPGTGRHRRAGG